MKPFLALSLPLYVIDQITKWWIVWKLNVGERIEAIQGTFWIDHVMNTGIAFGNFNGGAYSNYIFGAIAGIALIFILVLFRRGGFPTKIGRLAACLLVAGILGNLTDRFAHGYVVDFLTFDFGFWPFHPWPSFNVADACISIAAGCLFITAFQPEPGKDGGSDDKKAAAS